VCCLTGPSHLELLQEMAVAACMTVESGHLYLVVAAVGSEALGGRSPLLGSCGLLHCLCLGCSCLCRHLMCSVELLLQLAAVLLTVCCLLLRVPELLLVPSLPLL
jgi:hypothetical protein